MLVVAVAGCATPATRISASLQQYGIDKHRSVCLGTRLEKSLTLGQLRQLGQAGRELAESQGGALRVNDLMRAAGKVDDIKVPIEVVKAAGSCGLLDPRS